MENATRAERIAAGAIAGVFGAGAYMLEQAIDLRLCHHHTDDRLLLGRLITGDNDDAKTIGLAMHLMNGAVAGIAYTFLAEPLLPGPPLVKGLTFSLAETIALYPLAVTERHHPAIRDGTLASYLTPVGFAQQVMRHIAFGAVLGPVAARLPGRGYPG